MNFGETSIQSVTEALPKDHRGKWLRDTYLTSEMRARERVALIPKEDDGPYKLWTAYKQSLSTMRVE